ncbi:MAG: efflux RND transporter permease subunit [Proteobacteria bacterium]|nr:efflux RND transporter permease subunit [Pseudomonadota bacterium]
MNFATWAIREPVPPIVLFLVFVLAGSYAFEHLNIQDMPDMEFPAVMVTASLQGASPSQLETEVTRKLENALAGIEGIESMSSTVNEGVSTTMIQFVLERDTFEALDDVRSSVANARSELPRELEEPIVSRLNASGMPILTYTISSDSMDEESLSWFVDNVVSRKLTAIQGLASVTRLGGVSREIRVEIDPTKLAALGLTAADVSRQLKLAQMQTSGGRGEIGNARQSLRTIATVANAKELAEFDIAVPGGRHFRLDQVATIRDTVADRGQIALLDGRQVVAFQVQRARDSNAVALGREVAAAVAEMDEADNVEFELVVDAVERIEHEFQSSMTMLFEGALLAMLVVLIFLRDWRATLVSAVALPLSIIPTLAIIYFMGFSLNIITMLALTLVIGLLVDDTIVEVENIVRHLRNGKSPMVAAMDAATEIGLAVVATTLTLVAVFLPTAFMGGISGLFFQQFGWTASIAVLASLVVARLITPMLCSRFLKPHEGAAPEDSAIMKGYLYFAGLALRHKFLTSLGAALFFFGSIVGLAFLPQEFVPSGDFSRTSLSIELQPGTPIERTWQVAETVRQRLADIPEIERIFTTIGANNGGGMGSSHGGGQFSLGDIRKSTLTIMLTPSGDRSRSQAEIEQELRLRMRDVPGARFTVGYGGTGEKLQLNLTSEDPLLLARSADDVMRDLRNIPGLGNVSSNASLLRPEVFIRPDFARAAELGVTTTAIGQTVQVATAGDYEAALAKMNLPERQVDIRVQLPFSARQDLSTIKELRVPGSHGLVPLAAVADVRIGSGPAQISRYDRARNIQIDVELGSMKLGEASQLVDALPSLMRLPHGVTKLDVGDADQMKEMFGSFGLAMATGILCVFMVLVLLFKDFMQPITILAALPLSIGGAVLALLIANASFSMPAVIGLLMLMGITTKNSILLVDYAVVAMRGGMDAQAAVLDACRKRARPIVMTTLAMAAGMAPVALGLDADTSFRAPMGVVVIGGLLTSTVLSLVVVPVVFLYVLQAESLVKRMFGSARHPSMDHAATGATQLT